jgi:hypothetical protein
VLVGPTIAGMLDAVTPVGIRHGLKRPFIGIERLLDRRIADGVNRQLIALRVVIVHEIIHLVVQEHQPPCLGFAEIGLGHGGRLPAGTAVGEDLDGPDAQHGIACAGHDPIRMRLLHNATRSAEQALRCTHRQASQALSRAVCRDLPEARPHPDACIHHTRDAVGQAGPSRIVDRLDQFLIG